MPANPVSNSARYYFSCLQVKLTHGISHIHVVGNFVNDGRKGWRGLVALTSEGADIESPYMSL